MKFLTPWFLVPVILVLVVACGDTHSLNDPAMSVLTVSDIQAEMDRIADLNQTRDFSASVRLFEETAIGVDGANGQVLASQYICWDICPDIGAYFLVYPAVASESDCLAVSGQALFAPTPVPGPYVGCRAAVE